MLPASLLNHVFSSLYFVFPVTEQNEDDEDDGNDGTTKKRRRSERGDTPSTSSAYKPPAATSKGTKKTKASNTNKPKQIVRIRAKIHCTAAGVPGLEAPSRINIDDRTKGGGDGLRNLPHWHPLEKVPGLNTCVACFFLCGCVCCLTLTVVQLSRLFIFGACRLKH